MPSLAYLFPGQGAQAVGMGKAFYDQFDEAKEIYRTASRRLGFDVASLCFEGPQEELTKTHRCQPALFVTGLAAFAVLKRVVSSSLKPIAAAGLSLGELTALGAAEAFSLEQGCYLVQARGDLMTECAQQSRGAMLAVVGLSAEAIRPICEESEAVAANYNAQDQIVLSGTVEAIAKAEQLAKAQGAKRAVRLEVAGAFHSPLMQPAADKFKQVLANVEFRAPLFPIVSNVTGEPTQDPEAIRQLLAKQIVSPVRWEPSIRTLIRSGVTRFIEFPPATILTALLRRIDPSIKSTSINEPSDLDAVMTAVS